MLRSSIARLVAVSVLAICAVATSASSNPVSRTADSIGRYEIYTVPIDPSLTFRTATYTPSGKVLVSYAVTADQSERQVNLATMDDDGRTMRPFFSQAVPDRPKDNGLRFMVFADNKRIFLGDFIVECSTSLETCNNPALLPVQYPPEVADGEHISHRWSEMVIAPDNKHVSWTALLSNYSAVVFTGELERTTTGYQIVRTRIVSTVDPLKKDPAHVDGVIPEIMRGGEVKQFVNGGAGLSLAGALKRDLADSTVLHLASGEVEAITDTPGYDETTIFSPDERLGVVMTPRFSTRTDLAVLGLMPRPYAAALNMGLNSLAYNYSVSGVRQQRNGNIGPALIEIALSKTKTGYVGVNLNTDDGWVFGSPMSWHPSSTKAMWMEGTRGERGTQPRRMRVVRLLDYKPGRAVPAKATPDAIPYAITDLSMVKEYAKKSNDMTAKVYGQKAGYLTYRRTPAGLIEKTYFDFSDDGKQVYSGREILQNSRTGSVYTADVLLKGPRPGIMKLTIEFSRAASFYTPVKIDFTPDASGKPASNGFVEYNGQRMDVSLLLP